MNAKAKGSICGIASAITYGLNPLGALNLYSDGVNVDSVIFYRYGLAMIVLAGAMLLQKQSVAIGRRELVICFLLGVIFAMSSIALFSSFHYMEAGVACTLLFIYPVMVAVIMALFFKEKVTFAAGLAIAMAVTGVGMLYYGGGDMTMSTAGMLMVMFSSLAYALYIVILNRSRLYLPPITLTFFVMLFGTLAVALHSLLGEEYHLQLLTGARQWLWVLMLAIVPTVFSLVLMTVAIKSIGPTPTAIMGALEPVTAVVIGVTVFNESFTLRIAAGMLLILVAVSLIIIEKPLARRLLRNKK